MSRQETETGRICKCGERDCYKAGRAGHYIPSQHTEAAADKAGAAHDKAWAAYTKAWAAADKARAAYVKAGAAYAKAEGQEVC